MCADLISILFHQMIAREDFMTLVHGQQFHHWQTFLNNRMETQVTASAASSSS